jgi:hypothetical protein
MQQIHLAVTFSSEQVAKAALKALEGEIAAYHNWIASEVEKPGIHPGGATRLVADLRVLEDAAANIRKAFYEKHGYGYNIATGENRVKA